MGVRTFHVGATTQALKKLLFCDFVLNHAKVVNDEKKK